MHVAVLGAGVVGVTTAYYLVNSGHDVTVVDRAGDIATGCSFANGAQLSYSYTDAMANPGFLARIPRIVAGFDKGIRFRPPINPALVRWGVKFLSQCTHKKAIDNTVALLTLASHSQDLLAGIRTRLDADFSYRTSGKIVLLHGDQERDGAMRASALKAQHGSRVEVISMQDAIDIEPAIGHMTGDYSAAAYSPGDDVGDAHAFSQAVARYLRACGRCRFALDMHVEKIVADRGRAHRVETDKGPLDADAIVVCLGAWSSILLRPLGIDPGIYPARGYSVTLPCGPDANSIAVTDSACRFVVSRIGDRMRIAGFADFIGYRNKSDAARVARLVQLARTRAPRVADYAVPEQNAWGGFRPLTPSGRPKVGPTAIEGLFLNTGHGSLGWTLATASGEQLAKTIGPAREPATESSPDANRQRRYRSAAQALQETA